MFVIRRVQDDTMHVDKNAIMQVQEILTSQIKGLREDKIREIPEQLRNPLKFRFRTTLFVAENRSRTVQGFALMTFAPDLQFCFLDYIATRKDITSGGIGGSLYERVRDEADRLGAAGLFFECLPDDATLCKNASILEQNRARLKFYERYGAFPLANTKYEKPVTTGDDCPPYLVCDFLGKQGTIKAEPAKKIIHAILERKYGDLCPVTYINEVIESVQDDPVKLRKPLYAKIPGIEGIMPGKISKNRILLLMNDKHAIHHVNDKGYVESPVRISSIMKELSETGLFNEIPAKNFSEKYIRGIHDQKYINYFRRVCEQLPEGKSIYPYVFPIRNSTRAPSDDSVLAGYYCIDTFTPLNKNAYLAAKRAVDCALTGAEKLVEGSQAVYALVRPPGHHAERKVFGGFCYFNSGAIAANYLSQFGKVAMLDIDYHHGNGQQEIFYERSDVMTISIHGHPSFAYPYFSGYAEEKGEAAGLGYNVNYPLKEKLNGEEYRLTLEKAIRRIQQYKPSYMVVLFGLDTAKGDPTGTWSLSAKDFFLNGRMIGQIKMPVLFVQEGGYKNRVLGINARNFFQGFYETFFETLRTYPPFDSPLSRERREPGG